MAKHKSPNMLWNDFLGRMKRDEKSFDDMRNRLRSVGMRKFVEIIFKVGASNAHADISKIDAELALKKLKMDRG